MEALRKRLLALDPTLETYAAVDTGLAMEKVWGERAGLGWIGKNGCLINPVTRGASTPRPIAMLPWPEPPSRPSGGGLRSSLS